MCYNADMMDFTRTKIVCTIGPAVNTLEAMIELVGAGMNVARLNFSHGTHEEHARNIANLKRAREITGRPLAILLDTKGPEIRLGKIPGTPCRCSRGCALSWGPRPGAIR